jgi:hypothetical protein
MACAHQFTTANHLVIIIVIFPEGFVVKQPFYLGENVDKP